MANWSKINLYDENLLQSDLFDPITGIHFGGYFYQGVEEDFDTIYDIFIYIAKTCSSEHLVEVTSFFNALLDPKLAHKRKLEIWQHVTTDDYEFGPEHLDFLIAIFHDYAQDEIYRRPLKSINHEGKLKIIGDR